MGLFGRKKSPFDELQEQCQVVAREADSTRKKSEHSLRGKYEHMSAEERADLLKEALGSWKLAHSALDAARALQGKLDKAGSEEQMAAESLILSANLDVSKADASLQEARNSLMKGVGEVEEYFGPKSKEAKHLRKVLSEFQLPG
ncbi:MAG: hypothetical protein AAF533_19455 [Acidobacteriota bacterium]